MSIEPAVPLKRGLKGGIAHWAFLHPTQMQVHRQRSRFKVVVAGRRWGKTQLAKVEIVSRARMKKQFIWYVAPTYQMARQIMWQELLDALPRRWVKRMHETWMIIWLINGTVIQLKGADKPDTLRGVGLNFVVLDEFQDMRKETWTQVIRPTLAETRGDAMFIGTPKSFNHLYDLYMYGQRPDLRGELWYSWQFPTITSPFISASEIEQARADMDEKSFRQEFEASFETMSNRVYYAFDRNVHLKRVGFDQKLPIWVGMDFNIDPMSAIFMQPYEDGSIRVFGEKVIYNSNTEEMAQALDKQFFRHQRNVTLYPDPAGGGRGHQRGESDIEILRKQGFRRIKYRRKHPLVRDRVNAVNRMLRAANGDVRMFIDPSCEHLISSLEQTQYKTGTSEIDKRLKKEHETDALGYPIEVERPVRTFRYLGASI